MLPVRGGGDLGSLGVLGVCTACQALAGNWVHIAAPVCGSAACLENVDAERGSETVGAGVGVGTAREGRWLGLSMIDDRCPMLDV